MKKKKVVITLIITSIIVLINISKVYASSEEWSNLEIAYKVAATNSSVYNPNTGKGGSSNTTNSSTGGSSNTTTPSTGGSSGTSGSSGTGGSSGSTTSTPNTPDGVMQSAKDFITRGESSAHINESELSSTSNFLYNLLLGMGIVVAVIVGIILGMKYMVGSTEEQADIKQMLIPYIVGCFVVFGAFGIWKIAVNILLNM